MFDEFSPCYLVGEIGSNWVKLDDIFLVNYTKYTCHFADYV